MKKLLLLLLVPVFSCGQDVEKIKDTINNKLYELSDGPYIIINKDELIEKTILNGKISSKILGINTYDTIFYADKSTFNNVREIVALSDIHGQYDLAIKLLKNNKVIDKKLNWNFSKGHLVIVGDVFDRGDKINEVLWLIYRLEIQAKKKGGRVHFLLGNHEYMVLQKDIRYINKKYKLSAKLLDLRYDELYGDKTILGRWLRTKSTIIKINDNIFVHGGVSKEFIDKNGVNLERLNKMMREYIDTPKKELKPLGYYDLYYGQKGLIWYRGYFKKYFDKYKDDLIEKDITKILKLLESKHIVVGHCSNDKVVQLFNGKIFGVDSSIKKGYYGEVLFIKDKRFFRGKLNGELVKFE